MKNAFLALALTLSAPALADESWVADYDVAVKIAEKQGKDLLVDFTGSDWCGYCIRLHKEVFRHEEFLRPARKDFVLVSLDFPKRAAARAKVPNPERNAALAQLYGVTGYPTVLLMTTDGTVYGRTGYRKGGPQAYVGHLAELRSKGHAAIAEIQRLLDALEAAQGEQRQVALDQILKRLRAEPADSPFRDRLVGPLKQAVDVLPKQKAAEVVRELVRAQAVDERLVGKAAELDPKNEAGLYVDAVLAFLETGVEQEDQLRGAVAILDRLLDSGVELPELAAKTIYTMGAYWNAEFLKNQDKARRYARLGLAVASEDQLVKFFKSILGE